MFLGSQHFKGVEGRAKALVGLGRMTSDYSLIGTCTKPTHKLINIVLGAPLVLGRATSNFGLTKLTTTWTRGKPPPSPI
jgi:hypothetical protein